MAERSRCDLPYGHYGQVQFNLDDSKLAFGRNLGAPSSIEALRDLKLTNRRPESTIDEKAIGQGQPPSKRHDKQIKALIQRYPELEAGSESLSPLLRVSEAVQNTAWHHEPGKGTLIAFSKIWSHIRHKSIPLAALITGQTGSDLRLVQVQRQRRGWGDDRNSYLEVPTLYGEETIWSSDEGPIQQLHFAPAAERADGFLAVRLPSKTHLFRPAHRKTSLEDSSSNLALDRLFTVHTTHTGGRSHADVAFNPSFFQQVAIVDCAGGWTVLEFKNRKLDRVAQSWHGSLSADDSPATHTFDDGWARLVWIVNLTTLAICTRQSLNFVVLAADGTSTVSKLDLDPLGSASWILDILVLPGGRDLFVVLTTTHILLYKASTAAEGDIKAVIKARVRHFRHSEDITLRLRTWTEDQDVVLALFSSLSSPVHCFRLRKHAVDQIICEEPVELVLFPSETATDSRTSLQDLHIQPLRIVEKTSSKDHIPFHNARFYSFTALDAHQSVLEGLCYSWHGNHRGPQEVLAPAWESKLGMTGSRMPKEEFVVEDGSIEHDTAQSRSEPFARRTRIQQGQIIGQSKIVDLELIADDLRSSEPDNTAVEELCSSLADLVATTNPETRTPMRTLLDMTSGEVTTGDVQEASALLQQALHSITQEAGVDADVMTQQEHTWHFKVQKVTMPDSSLFQDDIGSVDSTLASVYDQLVSKWITSLPSQIPWRVRVAKSDIARRISMDLFLASRSICLEEAKEDPEPQQTQDTQTSGQTWELPVRGPDPPSQSIPTSSAVARHLSQRSALPTPSPTTTPSVITTSSRASSSAAPELHRLSKYTTFERPAPMVLPRSLTKVLSHWQLGADPDDYDWLSTSRRVTQHEDEEEEQGMTEKERIRIRRRTDRHIRRQRREAAASQASQLTSSQAPEIVSASQPTFKVESQPASMPGSSQTQGVSSGVGAASQVVPGRFGGRPPPKKKRKSGF